MNPQSARPHTVPFLPKQRIEEEAALLLAEYVENHPFSQPPIPIDDIVELHLGLTLEIEDLRSRFGHADVLGALWIEERTVRVDASLDPSANRRLLGRYHFTLAHEAGHWRLHRHHYERDRQQGLLFTEKGEPAYICRSSQAMQPVEWQANYFAACLLMPRKLVRDAWSAWRGDVRPFCVRELGVGTGSSDQSAVESWLRPLADRFEVSGEAMRIRLHEFGYLVHDEVNVLF